MNSNQQTTTFEAIGPSDALFAALNRDHSSTSASAIGERLAHVFVCKSREELSAMAVALDDEAGNAAIDHLTAAQESLAARLQIVEAALARLAIVAAPINQEH